MKPHLHLHVQTQATTPISITSTCPYHTPTFLLCPALHLYPHIALTTQPTLHYTYSPTSTPALAHTSTQTQATTCTPITLPTRPTPTIHLSSYPPLPYTHMSTLHPSPYPVLHYTSSPAYTYTYTYTYPYTSPNHKTYSYPCTTHTPATPPTRVGWGNCEVGWEMGNGEGW